MKKKNLKQNSCFSCGLHWILFVSVSVSARTEWKSSMYLFCWYLVVHAVHQDFHSPKICSNTWTSYSHTHRRIFMESGIASACAHNKHPMCWQKHCWNTDPWGCRYPCTLPFSLNQLRIHCETSQLPKFEALSLYFGSKWNFTVKKKVENFKLTRKNGQKEKFRLLIVNLTVFVRKSVISNHHFEIVVNFVRELMRNQGLFGEFSIHISAHFK